MARIAQNKSSGVKRGLAKDSSTEIDSVRFVQNDPGHFKARLPIFTAPESNGGVKKSYVVNGKKCYKAEHWTEKHRRTLLQKGTVLLNLRPYRNGFKLPCLVKLTRYAPKKLDKFDNLPMSLKYVLDAVCAVITGDYRPGRADSCEQIDVKYDQVICDNYSVLIEVISGEV